MPSLTSSFLKCNFYSSHRPVTSSELLVSFSNASESLKTIIDAKHSALIIDKWLNSSLTKSGKFKTELIASIIDNNDKHSIQPIKIFYNAKKNILNIEGKAFILNFVFIFLFN